MYLAQKSKGPSQETIKGVKGLPQLQVKIKMCQTLQVCSQQARAVLSSTYINKILLGNMYVNTFLLFHRRSGKVQKQPHANKTYCLCHLIHYRTVQ